MVEHDFHVELDEARHDLVVKGDAAFGVDVSGVEAFEPELVRFPPLVRGKIKTRLRISDLSVLDSIGGVKRG